MSQWYAIRIVTQREDKVTASLTEHGFSTFSPHERVNRKIGREMTQHDRPMFPGYLFVLCEERDIAPIRKIVGVLEFVRYMQGGVAVPVVFPLAVIVKIQIEERSGAYDRTTEKPNTYRPIKGDRVQITAGPYIKHIATLLSTPRGRRAKVMIEGMFEPRRKTIDVDYLKAA